MKNFKVIDFEGKKAQHVVIVPHVVQGDGVNFDLVKSIQSLISTTVKRGARKGEQVHPVSFNTALKLERVPKDFQSDIPAKCRYKYLGGSERFAGFMTSEEKLPEFIKALDEFDTAKRVKPKPKAKPKATTTTTTPDIEKLQQLMKLAKELGI